MHVSNRFDASFGRVETGYHLMQMYNPSVENLNAPFFAHQRRIPNDYCNNYFDTEYKDMLTASKQ